jgi:hypothetical protein
MTRQPWRKSNRGRRQRPSRKKDGIVAETLRVLIVEDAEDDAALVLRELHRGGHRVSHCRVDTVKALDEALRTQKWDLLISDFSLPTMTAMDALTVLGASGVDLPCIVMSGTIEEEAAVHAMRSGARDFVTKDRLARLLPAVSRELREAAQRRQKRAAEVALDEAEGRMRFALQAARVGTWQSNIVSGETSWSDVLEQLHGLPVGGFGGTFEDFIHTIHPDDRQMVRERLAQSLRDHTESRLEYRVIWPDGSIHWIAGVGQTFYDERGRGVRAAGVGMDITVQKNLEDQFRQAQRMESIGQLAGGIAHDFNNLLTAILGYSDVLLGELTGYSVPETVRDDLEEIRKAAERAAALTSQLLAFSRRQIIQPKVLNLNSIVENFQPMLKRLIGEDIQIAVRLSEDLGSVNADVGQLEQVIMNLVVNARDAMPTGGALTIETANVDLDESYARSHVTVEPGPHVMLAVCDTGTGISPEVQARIFEPFFTTKPKDRGTGLGLATIYGIVKQNKGSIWVYSEPDKGTTFKIYLPRVSDGPRVEPRKVQTAASGGNETVLLVEDDERVAKLAREILKRNGYVIIQASDADDAVRLAEEHKGSIDLLLTDVVMPGRSGSLLAEELSARAPGMRVLYMSGYTDNAIVDHGLLSPGVAFLQKPFTRATLTRAVRNVLDS